MKMKPWLLLALTLSASFAGQLLLADDQPGPAPGANTPPANSEQPSKKKKAAVAKKPAASPKKSTAAAPARITLSWPESQREQLSKRSKPKVIGRKSNRPAMLPALSLRICFPASRLLRRRRSSLQPRFRHRRRRKQN